jgi:hypothetical protein
VYNIKITTVQIKVVNKFRDIRVNENIIERVSTLEYLICKSPHPLVRSVNELSCRMECIEVITAN